MFKPTEDDLKATNAEVKRMEKIMERLEQLNQMKAALDKRKNEITDKKELEKWIELNQPDYDFLNQQFQILAKDAITPKGFFKASGDDTIVKWLNE